MSEETKVKIYWRKEFSVFFPCKVRAYLSSRFTPLVTFFCPFSDLANKIFSLVLKQMFKQGLKSERWNLMKLNSAPILLTEWPV